MSFEWFSYDTPMPNRWAKVRFLLVWYSPRENQMFRKKHNKNRHLAKLFISNSKSGRIQCWAYDFHLMKSKTSLFVLFFLRRYTFSSHTSHKRLSCCVCFISLLKKKRITTINRYAFVERAQKSWFLSDLYQIFSFFSKTIRSDQIFKYS